MGGGLILSFNWCHSSKKDTGYHTMRVYCNIVSMYNCCDL